MKKNEIIELNGVEYTLELNRDSFVQIDRACNYQKTMQIIYGNMYEFYDDKEFDDNFDPEMLIVKDEDIDKQIELKNQALEKLVNRAYLIWLYPNHKLKPNEVKEILKPYLEDDKKAEWLMIKTGEFLQECIAIRQQYNEERKNLKAQINKK